MANTFQVTIVAVDQCTAVIRKINASMDKALAPINRAKEGVNNMKKAIADNAVVKGLSGIGAEANNVAKKIGSIMAPMAAVVGIGSVAGVAALATEWGKLGFEITNAANGIGISAGELQSLRGAAGMAGVSVGELDGGLKAIGDTWQNAQFGRNQDALMMMNKLGISVHRLKDGSVDATRGLMDISRSIQGRNAEVQRLIANTFGVGSLLPLLQKGPAAIAAFQAKYESLAGVMGGPSLAAASAFHEQMILLHGAVDGLKNRIGDKLIPILSPLVEQLTNWIGANKDLIATKIGEFVKGIGDWLKTVDFKRIGNGILGCIDRIKKFVDSIGGWKVAAIGLIVVMNGGLIASVLNLGLTLGTLAVRGIPLAIKGLGLMKDAMVANDVLTVKSIGNIGGLIGKLGALGAAASAGYAAGSYVVKPLVDMAVQKVSGDQHATLGTKLFDLLHPAATFNVSKTTSKAALGATQKLMAMGWTKEQAAGIAGSVEQESGMNPSARNSKSGAYGIGQWLGSRVQDFKKFSGKELVGSSLDDQLAFMNYELTKGKEQWAGNTLKESTSASDAAKIHSDLYERPGAAEANIAQRQANANGILSMMSVGGGVSTAASPDANAAQRTANADGMPGAPNAAPTANTPTNLNVSPLLKTQTAAAASANPATPDPQQVTVHVVLGNTPPGTTATAKNVDGSSAPVRIAYTMPTTVTP